MTQKNESKSPRGWAVATIDMVVPSDGVFCDGDWVESKDQDPDGKVRLIQLADIGDGEFLDKSARFLTKKKAHELKCTFLAEGDLLIARMPDPLGRACIFPLPGQEKFVTVVDVCIVRIDNKFVNPQYLMHVVNSPALRRQIESYKSGSTRKRISRGNLARVQFPVPPRREQDRIIAKIEEVFSELDNGIENLETAREQLKVYRQALLKHAFDGKMTADWREKNKRKLKSADALRSEILDVRRATWETTQSRRYKMPVSIDAEDLPSLPRAWAWVSLDELVSGEPRSLQSGPFGSSLKHSEFRQEGILVIGIDNVGSGQFSLGSQNRLPKAKFKKLIKYQARAGDLLITVMASLGRTCVVPRSLETAIITKHVYRVSMDERYLLPEFYNLALQGPTISRKRMLQGAQGQTRPGLNSSILREIPLPLCSLAEQQEIVSRLSQRLSEIEILDKAVQEELLRAEALRQAILKTAFLGRLVAQDPNDEPASLLLERIKRGTAETENNKKKIREKDAV